MKDVAQELIRCRAWIEAALDYSGGTHDFADVVQAVIQGSMQLWAGDDACAVTEIIHYPKKKTLHVFLAGGKMETILDMQESAAQWGKLQGCDTLTIAGRHGWLKVLNKHGWEPSFSVMSKEIS